MSVKSYMEVQLLLPSVESACTMMNHKGQQTLAPTIAPMKKLQLFKDFPSPIPASSKKGRCKTLTSSCNHLPKQ